MTSASLHLRARIANPAVRAVLRSPLHRLLSGSVLELTYTGRKTGQRHALPVMYATMDGDLVIIAGRPGGKSWWRNFSARPRQVDIRLRGDHHIADALLLASGTDAYEEALAAYRDRYPRTLIEPRTPILTLHNLSMRPDGPS
ncbi:nitroreductase family deazaflavin-dependent oxidoreductase [Actinomadura scrupuli]|uniref:nitroreductase family deazaflavin-dependent oxidoreductase n=1 Tax=Actinomadura scrupuli TaxID=559629 RepID=UPI003D999336